MGSLRKGIRSLVVVIGWSSFHVTHCGAQRVSGSIIQYDFPREECLAKSFTDSAAADFFGALNRADTTSCNDGLGVSLYAYDEPGAAQIISASTSASFVTHMTGKSSYTVEFWAATAVNLPAVSTNRPLVTIGAVGDATPDTCEVTNGYGTYSLTVYDRQSNAQFYNQYGAKSGSSFYCPVLASGPGVTTTASHFVITTTSGTTANTEIWYVDGVQKSLSPTVGSGKGGAISGLWASMNPDHKLGFFGDTQVTKPTIPWNGALYMFALYDTALSAADVATNYAAKLPDSPPTVLDFTAAVNENGMPHPFPGTPELYHEGMPNDELGWISLDAIDQDEISTYPNYVVTNRATKYMKLFVNSLPSLSKIYDYTTGNEITTVPTEVIPTFTDGSGYVYTPTTAQAVPSTTMLFKTYRVRIRPQQYLYSATNGNGKFQIFDNFTFFAKDGLTGIISPTNASCHIVVTPLDTPPLPRNDRVYLPAGIIKSIHLNVSDVDNNETFQRAFITKYPSRGVLIGVNRKGLNNNCSIADPKNTGRPSELVVCSDHTCDAQQVGNVVNLVCSPVTMVGYIADDLTQFKHLNASDGILGEDSFEYIVVDRFGMNSTVAKVTIFITTPLTVKLTTTKVVAYKNVHSTFYVSGRDLSNQNRNLKVEIVRLPNYGSLVDASTGKSLSVGSLISGTLKSPFTNTLGCYYLGQNGYFNTPITTWNGTSVGGLTAAGDDTFSFRVVAMDGSGLVSTVATVSVIVTNVNGATVLEGPSGPLDKPGKPLEIYAYSSFGSTTSSTSYPTTLTIAGLTVSSPDGDLDIVKVHIECEYGRITINPSATRSLDFTSTTYCYGTNQDPVCKNAYGDGFRETIFLGVPSAVDTALKNLEYLSTTSQIIDECRITIFDGANGKCMPLSMLNSRRSGVDSNDISGGISCYASIADVSRGRLSPVACYGTSVGFNVSVLEYSFIAAENASGCAYPYCLSLQYFILLVAGAILGLIIVCISCCTCIQNRYQRYLRSLVGLDLYDEEEADDDDEAKTTMLQRNKPSNWKQVRVLPGDACAEPEYYYANGVTGDAQWDRPLFTLGPPHKADFTTCFGPENDPTMWLKDSFVHQKEPLLTTTLP